MKTFIYSDYADQWPRFINDFNQELGQALTLPIKLEHRTYGKGTLQAVSAKLVGSRLEVSITYEKKSTPEVRDIYSLLDCDFITMGEEDRKLLTEAQESFKTVFYERVAAIDAQSKKEAAERRQKEADIARRAQEIKKQQQAENRRKKMEAKLDESKAAYIQKFHEMLTTKKTLSVSDDFYYTLGWLAKHSGVVKAIVPDICEADFIQYFGTEAPYTKTVYKVGPGGWISQWGKSFTASLVKVSVIPTYLEQYLNPKRTQVTNSEYIKELIDNYGFQFGKKQDTEAIRKSIPEAYLPHFEAGYAA